MSNKSTKFNTVTINITGNELDIKKISNLLIRDGKLNLSDILNPPISFNRIDPDVDSTLGHFLLLGKKWYTYQNESIDTYTRLNLLDQASDEIVVIDDKVKKIDPKGLVSIACDLYIAHTNKKRNAITHKDLTDFIMGRSHDDFLVIETNNLFDLKSMVEKAEMENLVMCHHGCVSVEQYQLTIWGMTDKYIILSLDVKPTQVEFSLLLDNDSGVYKPTKLIDHLSELYPSLVFKDTYSTRLINGNLATYKPVEIFTDKHGFHYYNNLVPRIGSDIKVKRLQNLYDGYFGKFTYTKECVAKFENKINNGNTCILSVVCEYDEITKTRKFLYTLRIQSVGSYGLTTCTLHSVDGKYIETDEFRNSLDAIRIAITEDRVFIYESFKEYYCWCYPNPLV